MSRKEEYRYASGLGILKLDENLWESLKRCASWIQKAGNDFHSMKGGGSRPSSGIYTNTRPFVSTQKRSYYSQPYFICQPL
jgi:hypothetical protein